MEKYIRDAALKMALNRLYYVQDVYSKNLIDPEYAERILDVYSEEQITTMYNAIKLALSSREEDYSSMLHGTHHSNDDILYYFEMLCVEIEKTGIIKNKV